MDTARIAGILIGCMVGSLFVPYIITLAPTYWSSVLVSFILGLLVNILVVGIQALFTGKSK